MLDLCVVFGFPRPSDLLASLSGAELRMWLKYASQKGLPWTNAEEQRARHTALLHNINCKEGHSKSPAEFLPRARPKKLPDPDELRTTVRAFGHVLRNL